MRGSTFLLAPMKTDGLISVHLRDKRKTPFPIFFLSPSSPPSRSSLSVSSFFFPFEFPFSFYPFLSFFFKKIWIHGSHCAMCPSLIQVCFYLETIYFFSIQFILNELSSSHFLTSEIFVKISSLESLATYHSENRKNIPTISEFDKTFLGQWILQDKSNGSVHFVIQDLENFLGFLEPL